MMNADLPGDLGRPRHDHQMVGGVVTGLVLIIVCLGTLAFALTV
jgi:hypothetical protein